MLILIENTPRAYAWGSRDALPELLGIEPNGEPQAELWLGAHPGAPASLAKASPATQNLIELIESDPERYGVDGAQLPFLLKVLAIGAPLSLQVHPDLAQAREGYGREEAAGVPRDARERNYRDPNHKPELLVALGEVTALSGFRPLAEARRELRALAAAAAAGPGAEALAHAADLCDAVGEADASTARTALLEWALGGGEAPQAAARAIAEIVAASAAPPPDVEPLRRWSLERLTDVYPGDTGVLISMLLHVERLQPGEAIYLGARQLHAYLDGIAVEVMAASDNVLRAGFTEKHLDVAELMRIVDPGSLESPRLAADEIAPGLVAWQPPVQDFKLLRARVRDDRPGQAHDIDDVERADDAASWAGQVRVEARHPLVLVMTSGRVRIDRRDGELDEFAVLKRGQSMYVSAGDPIELSGDGEVFIATVGAHWSGVSQLSSRS